MTNRATPSKSGLQDGERKLVTVLFTDIVGSTALAERLDPEEWADIVSGAHAIVSEAVERYGGLVAQLLGDGALAFFGAPTAHEDDPERAVSAALDIIAGIADYALELRRAGRAPDFRMRVGLNTGLVVVGNIGAGRHVEYLAVGDTVNLAARMQSAAEPNSVLIAESTARATDHAFDLQPVGLLDLKGKSEPVPAYRVLAPRTVYGSRRGIAGLTSPIVGRDAEIALIQERLAALSEGRGGIVSIMGEAGLGKSRLTSEIILRSPLSFTCLEGRCLSFQTATPFAPFADMLTRHFGLAPGETDAQKHARIGDPYLAALLGVTPQGEDAYMLGVLDPPQLRERTFEAVAALLSRLAGQHPIVLVIEDLHWADSASLSLLQHVLALTAALPILLVAVFRPVDSEPAWGFHTAALAEQADRYTPILLQPLKAGEARTLVANLLEIEDLPETVRELILKKAEGNPFFVEEVIRSLLDAKLVMRDGGHWRATRAIADVSLPETLAGVITARLDRLDETSKRVAHTAAVIGRAFDHAILAEVAESLNGLDAALRDLENRELILADAKSGRSYRFKHVLTQEAAYNSLLLSRRRTLHRRAAEALERRAPDQGADIGRHFVGAQEPARALPYLLMAADRAARSYATPEAVGLYAQALDIAKRLDAAAAARRAFEGLGGAFSLGLDVPRALETYREMEQFALAHGDAPMRVSALNKSAYVSSMFAGDFPSAMGQLQQSEQLARACGDKPGLSEHIITRCTLMMASGDFDETVHYMNEVVALGRDMNLGSQMAYGLTHTANALTYLTRFDEGWEKAQEARRVAEENGDKLHLAEVMTNPLAFGRLRNGDIDGAMASAREGYEMAARIGGLYMECIGLLMHSWMSVMRGEYEAALALLDRASTVGTKSGLQFFPPMAMGWQAESLYDLSAANLPKAQALMAQALAMMDHPMGAMSAGMAMMPLGKLALASGDPQQAIALHQRGMTTPTPFMHTQRPFHLVGQALAALAQSRLDAAAGYVREARGYAEGRRMRHCMPQIDFADGQVEAARRDDAAALARFDAAALAATDMRMRPILWRARNCAADALLRLGRADEASARRRQAAAAVQDIAELMTDPARRAAYLASVRPIERRGADG